MNQADGTCQGNLQEETKSNDSLLELEPSQFQKSTTSSGNQTEKSDDFTFGLELDPTTDRKIKGVAHFEKADRENEIILIDAFANAAEEFMKHPILHLNHTERPVGFFTKAQVEGKSFIVEASLFDTPDTDDVWEAVKKGIYNKFSVFGRRKVASPECRLPPGMRSSPCITKAIALWSISLVGGNAVNTDTYVDIVKAFKVENSDKLIKCNRPNLNTMVDSPLLNTIEKCNEGDLHKSEDTLIKDDRNTSSILERIKGMEEILNRLVESDAKVHAGMGDNMEKADEGTEQVAHPEQPIQKAEVVTPTEQEKIEVFTKAQVEEIISDKEEAFKKAFMTTVNDEIKKAFDEKFAEVMTRIEKVENETIQKGGTVVVVNSELDKPLDKPLDINERVSNLKALGGK